MNRRRWELGVSTFALIAALYFIVNPEFRALVIVVQSLGIELVLALLAIQLRSFIPVVEQLFARRSTLICRASCAIVRGTLRAAGVLVLPSRASYGLCLLLFVLSRSLWCPFSGRTA